VGKNAGMTLAGTFGTRSMDMRAPDENSFKGTVFLQRKKPSDNSRLLSKLNDMGLSDKLSFNQPVSVTLAKVDARPEEKKSLPTNPVASNEPAVAPRKTDVIRRISFGADSIVISLYDNGEVDGDTVSILLNGKVILSRQGLTEKAITKTIYASDIGDSSELVMFAENLGRIPPNSGLLVIQSGYERYHVQFSGDLQHSSGVILRRRRP
jgi:hypothetical protein